MYNQHTRGITAVRHRDLDEGRKDFVRDPTHTYTHTHKKKKLMKKTDLRESKKEIPVYRVSSIATRPFFLSNKSNINQICDLNKAMLHTDTHKHMYTDTDIALGVQS